MISQTVLAVLSLIEGILPMLGTSSATTDLISKIIDALTKLMPFIVDEIQTVYTSVKNIITELQSSNATPTPDQIAALQALDSQVDSAWVAVQASFDPDAGSASPASGTASKSS